LGTLEPEPEPEPERESGAAQGAAALEGVHEQLQAVIPQLPQGAVQEQLKKLLSHVKFVVLNLGDDELKFVDKPAEMASELETAMNLENDELAFFDRRLQSAEMACELKTQEDLWRAEREDELRRLKVQPTTPTFCRYQGRDSEHWN
jgi:hypothetical protein